MLRAGEESDGSLETSPGYATSPAKGSSSAYPRPLILDKTEARYGVVPSLDGLRAFSILPVLIGHLTPYGYGSATGVFMFFVISGFLITRLLLAERKSTGRIAIGGFYLRRIVRLYPVVLLYTAVILIVFSDKRIHWIEPFGALFYFENYVVSAMSVAGERMQLPFQVFWSLAVEEQFYIVFPLLFVLARTPKQIAIGAAVVCLAILANRSIAVAIYPELLPTHFFYVRTEFRADALAFGVLLAALCELPIGGRVTKLAASWPCLALAGLLLAVSAMVKDPVFRSTIRDSLTGVSLMIILATVIFTARLPLLSRLLNTQILMWVGRLSYSLYVWHMLALIACRYVVTEGPWWHITVIAFPLTFLMAAASYYLVERPFVILRQRLGSRTAGQAGAT